jgi:hypothetical protein
MTAECFTEGSGPAATPEGDIVSCPESRGRLEGSVERSPSGDGRSPIPAQNSPRSLALRAARRTRLMC